MKNRNPRENLTSNQAVGGCLQTPKQFRGKAVINISSKTAPIKTGDFSSFISPVSTLDRLAEEQNLASKQTE